VSGDSPPFYFADNQGHPQGWLVDLWRLWARKSDIEIAFKTVPFGKTIELVRNGEADIHAGLFHSKERERHIDFVMPMVDVTTHYFHHKNIHGIESLEELKPYRIGVTQGDYTVEYLDQHLPGATLAVYPDNQTQLDAAKNGEIKVLVKDTGIAQSMLSERDILYDFVHAVDQPLYAKPLIAAVHKNHPPLADHIHEGMHRISGNEKAEFDRRWSGSAQTRTRDVFVVTCPQDYAPFSMKTPSGEATGMLVDLWRLWL
jgi:ABC-type amino acid transport substrate-binding protein